VTAIISDNLTQDTELGDNLVENEEGCCLPIGFYGRHGFDPLGKVVDSHANVLMPPTEVGLQLTKYAPHLVKGLMVMTG
jgi:hypothetical protein